MEMISPSFVEQCGRPSRISACLIIKLVSYERDESQRPATANCRMRKKQVNPPIDLEMGALYVVICFAVWKDVFAREFDCSTNLYEL
jgi:hypothetical protein